MLVTEILETITELSDDLWLGANDNSKEAFLKEARAWESHGVLISKQLFAEINVIVDSLELIHLNFYHHVHSSTTFNWLDTFYCAKTFECCVCTCLKL